VLSIAGPVTGIAIVYQDNLTELVVPPELTNVLNNTFALGQQITLAKVIDMQLDNASCTVTLTVNFTNPLDCTLSLNLMSASVECASHNVVLGTVNSNDLGEVAPAESTIAVAVGIWTENGMTHVETEHAGATYMDLNLVGFTININSMEIILNEPLRLPDVPIA
jgi:hypothetical protein